MTYEVRECATLGTNFRDIYRDGDLFAMQVPRGLAEQFVATPRLWGSVHAPVPMLRTWMLEQEDREKERSG